jgi:hypothetical protein
MNQNRQTAGELSKKALSDTTVYNATEVGQAMVEDIEKHLYDAVKNYIDKIDQEKFCVVMLIGKDLLLTNLIRRKFYCWPFLPKPRPNQAVFLYEKSKDKITKCLWILPCDAAMSELASLTAVHKKYKNMQKWSKAFFDGKFWDTIRNESRIDLKSEYECLQELMRENSNLRLDMMSFRDAEVDISQEIAVGEINNSMQICPN